MVLRQVRRVWLTHRVDIAVRALTPLHAADLRTLGSNNRFVTERDGCNGRWQVRADSTAPGGVVLRMDWEAGQYGNYAEFERQGPGSFLVWVARSQP